MMIINIYIAEARPQYPSGSVQLKALEQIITNTSREALEQRLETTYIVGYWRRKEGHPTLDVYIGYSLYMKQIIIENQRLFLSVDDFRMGSLKRRFVA